MTQPVSPYVQQRYQVQYLQVDGNLMTEVDTIDITTTDGGEDIKTLVRGLAGRTGGAAMTTLSFSGSVPYLPTDTGGAGFDSGGMVSGKGVQLDQTMLTNLNQNGGQPVQFIVFIGNPAAQKGYFDGQINSVRTNVSVGKRITFTMNATGTFFTYLNQL